MDFEGNLRRVKESIARTRKASGRYRCGPELEITGYGCEDHFLEMDTFEHAWEALAELIVEGFTDDLLVDVGMPVYHRGASFNCRVVCHNRKVVLIRPKQILADDGNYREPRWFRPWPANRALESFILPQIVAKIDGQATCPIGDAIIQCNDASIAFETCEELFAIEPTSIRYYLSGVDIISNGSGSHHNLRKLNNRVELLRSATTKSGGCYLYSNQIGCDGGRLYYDGSAMVMMNGDCFAQAKQFSISDEVEVVTALVDLDEVESYRVARASSAAQAARGSYQIDRISVDFNICSDKSGSLSASQRTTLPKAIRYHTPEQEIAFGPASWLWDYLRRSGMNGFFLPLSGGADSSSTAAIVGCMCQLVVDACIEGNSGVLEDIRRVVMDPNYTPVDPRELAGRFFHTSFMSFKNHSSASTTELSRTLADQVGAYHINLDIFKAFEAIVDTFSAAFPDAKRPTFKAYGGSVAENLALQNIQARTRMVLAYLFAQLSLWARGTRGGLLVLGSANVDEGLRGYLTKYDCSAADINPIGGISKADLRRFLTWASKPKAEGVFFFFFPVMCFQNLKSF